MGKFLVEFKAFKSGEWYEKTDTDSKPSAFSVASISCGRSSRITDTDTDEIIFEKLGDQTIYDEYGTDA